MSQNNNIKITPQVGVSSDPKIEFTGAGNSTITLSVGSSTLASLEFEDSSGDIFAVGSIGENEPHFSVTDKFGIPMVEGYLDSKFLLAPYPTYQIGFGITALSQSTYKVEMEGGLKVGAEQGSQAFDIGTDLVVSSSGAFNPKVTIGSSVGAASTEKMEISAVSRDNGLLEIANYGGNQLFSVSNDQSESVFSVYRYANYENLSITSFENRNLFSVSPLGIVTTYGALRVGTSITTADSSVYNELYGRLNVRAPFSTATEYVSIVPKFSDKGALSFEAPVGTAQTDRGTQIFSISNNLDSSIFRVNDLNRNPIFEASSSGNAGFGTTNPQAKLEVHGTTRFTSAGSTASAYVDVNHYKNFEYAIGAGVATDTRNAISFESAAGIGTYGMPGQLMSLIDGGNVFTATGYKYWSSAEPIPAIDVTFSGDVGIGSTQPTANLDVAVSTLLVSGITTLTNNVVIRDRISFSEEINPGINSTTTIKLEPQTPGISTYAPTRGSLLFAGSLDQSLNGGQLVTVVNDNDSLFTVNRFAGLSTTNVTGTRSIETVLDVTSSGTVGIGTTIPSTKMDVRGDVRVGIDTSQGLILTSPNGTTFRLVVDDSGNLSAISTTL